MTFLELCIFLFFSLHFTLQYPLLPLKNGVEDPMYCTEVSINFSLTIFKTGYFPNVTIHTNMALFRDTETQDYNIRMSDYYGHEITDNLPLDAICYQNINTQCNYNCSIPYFDFDLNEFDPLIEIEGDFVKENDHGIEIYGAGIAAGYFSNGSLFPFYGTLYSPNIPCNSFVLQRDIEKYSVTSCCTKFLPAPKAPRTPSCKVFQGTVTFYNGDNTVFAESSMYYFLNGGKIYTVGNYSTLSKYPFPSYFFNILSTCGSKDSPKLKCIISLPSGDSRLFISFAYTSEGFYGDSPLMAANVGSIIFRNKQTLMDEGVPFTLDSACISYTGHNYLNKPSISKFCCIEFE